MFLLTQQDVQALISHAQTAAKAAYAPYSHFSVGAALLAEDGRIFTGCNVENASYGATICAERCAVANAVSEGIRRFTAIAICTADGTPAPPCGICRQVLFEFMPEGKVILWSEEKGTEIFSLSALLPLGFRLENER